jgi:hypothetical protein
MNLLYRYILYRYFMNNHELFVNFVNKKKLHRYTVQSNYFNAGESQCLAYWREGRAGCNKHSQRCRRPLQPWPPIGCPGPLSEKVSHWNPGCCARPQCLVQRSGSCIPQRCRALLLLAHPGPGDSSPASRVCRRHSQPAVGLFFVSVTNKTRICQENIP